MCCFEVRLREEMWDLLKVLLLLTEETSRNGCNSKLQCND